MEGFYKLIMSGLNEKSASGAEKVFANYAMCLEYMFSKLGEWLGVHAVKLQIEDLLSEYGEEDNSTDQNNSIKSESGRIIAHCELLISKMHDPMEHLSNKTKKFIQVI